jgi:hypothetical protein
LRSIGGLFVYGLQDGCGIGNRLQQFAKRTSTHDLFNFAGRRGSLSSKGRDCADRCDYAGDFFVNGPLSIRESDHNVVKGFWLPLV